MQARIVHLGLTECPICATGQLLVWRLPVILAIGGEHYEPTDSRHDPEANTQFLVEVACDVCGYVLLFDSERLEPSNSRTLVVGMTEDEEAALDSDEDSDDAG
ncbi:MAG: hypothetical protein JWM93_1073 [Frankiales bacterium]|nr:hypothetical protein [Frankiales bacterium]